MSNKNILEIIEKIKNSNFSQYPFDNLVIDSFLPADFADKLYQDFTNLETLEFDNIFKSNYGEKKEIKSKKIGFDTYNDFIDLISDDELLSEVSKKFNTDRLFPDEAFDGGGYVISPTNSFLSYHADFNFSNKIQKYRTINLIIYFNKNYESEFGGKLHLLDPLSKTVETEIEPIFNRAVLFKTNENTPHGVSRNREDFERRSFNCYFYTNSSDNGNSQPHKTLWI